MPIDVFLRAAPETRVRLYLELAAIERWKLETDINLRVLWRTGSIGTTFPEHDDCPIEVFLPSENFQWTSRDYAEKHATTSPYIFVDSDHMLLGRDWVQRAMKLWYQFADNRTAFFGSDSIMPSENQKANYERNTGQQAGEVYQAPYAMGAPLIHRKGVIDYSQFSGPAPQQDDIVTQHLRAKGMRFCYMRDILYLHLGFGLSQVQPLLWLKY